MKLSSRIMAAVAAVLALLLPPVQAQQRITTIKAWTIGPDAPSVTRFSNLQAAAERLNADLRREGVQYQIKVEGSFDTTNWDQFLRRVLLAFQGGDPPDIVQASAALSTTWAAAGFLAPLDDYVPKYKPFSDIVPALWTSVKYKGKTWGIPQDT
jgi:inositol-phosphate transport system substrate-binding protein